MFEVGMRLPRAAKKVLGAGLLAALSAASLVAQTVHRETNAAREARIQRTIQETYSHKWEVFGGGGYLRFRNGEDTKKNNEVSWETEANYYLNRKLAVVGDVRGSFGNGHSITNDGFAQIPNPQINEYFFLGGVGYRFLAQEKYAVSGEALVGDGWGIFSGGSKGIPSTTLGLWQDASRPAFSLGLRLEYNFFPNLAFQVKPTYVGTTFTNPTDGGTLQNNFGFNAGIVYRFGRQ
jgi:opacity protein-like surface antigen